MGDLTANLTQEEPIKEAVMDPIEAVEGTAKVAKFTAKLLAVAARAIANKILGMPKPGIPLGGGIFGGTQAGTDTARPIVRVDDGWGFVVDSDVTKLAADPGVTSKLTPLQKTKLAAFVASTVTRTRAELAEDE